MRPPHEQAFDQERASLEDVMDRYATVGGNEYFALLYDGIAPAVLQLARQYTHRRDEQDAIVRAVMTALHEQRSRYIPGSDVMTWVMGLAQAAIDYAGYELPPLVRIGGNDTMAPIPVVHLHGITDRHRRAHALVHDQGMSVREAAEVMDLRPLKVADLVTEFEAALREQENEHNETEEQIDLRPTGADAPKEDLRAGDIIDDHRIVRWLGKGGDATVYEAVDLASGTACAMKVLGHTNPHKIKRFNREVEMLRKAAPHPHIVQVFQEGVLPDRRCYYTMELLKGCTLREFMSRRLDRRKSLEWSEVQQIALDVCDALCTVHDGGDVHRDIKPENIFVTTDSRAKLLDFGVAKSGQPDEPQLTADGDMIGTQAYLAPECGRSRPDARADIYALGITMYEMLVGRRPFWKPGARFEFGEALQHAPPLMRDKRPGLHSTDELEALIQRAIASDPQKRYATVREFQRCIRKLDQDGRGELDFRLRSTSTRTTARAVLYGAASAAATLGMFGGTAALECGNDDRLPHVGPALDDEHIDSGLLRISDLLTRCGPPERNEPTEPMRVKFGILGETGEVVNVTVQPPHDDSRQGRCVRDAVYQARFGTFDQPQQDVERDL